ncbi:uncharacterized protein ACR2FA_010417 [Aphomia sociella]
MHLPEDYPGGTNDCNTIIQAVMRLLAGAEIRVLENVSRPPGLPSTPTYDTNTNEDDISTETAPIIDKPPFDNIWAWVLIVCGTVTIITILISIAKAIRRHIKTLAQRDAEYENLTSQNTPNFPATSKLEDTYCNPADMMSSSGDIYAQPYRPSTVEELYATPMPKSSRNKPIAECLYAELNLPDKKNELYAEILPKNIRKKTEENNYASIKELTDRAGQDSKTEYANTFDKDRYVNSKDSGNTEYVEPSYCEVGRRK